MPQPTQIKKLAIAVYRFCQEKKESEIKVISQHLFELFNKKGNRRQLKELIRSLEQLEERHGGVTKLRLTTAWPLESSTKEKIVKSLGLSKVEIDARVDSKLLGGFEARFNDKVINGSLKFQLQSLL